MAWKEIGGVKSTSSKNRVYSLEVNEDGEMRCSCPAFTHSPAPRWCKHIDSDEAQRLYRKHLDSTRNVWVVKTVYTGDILGVYSTREKARRRQGQSGYSTAVLSVTLDG